MRTFTRTLTAAVAALIVLTQVGCAAERSSPLPTQPEAQSKSVQGPGTPQITVEFECGELSLLLSAKSHLDAAHTKGTIDDAAYRLRFEEIAEMWATSVFGNTPVSTPALSLRKQIASEDLENYEATAGEAKQACWDNGSGILTVALPSDGNL